jgi:hypothetical protein
MRLFKPEKHWSQSIRFEGKQTSYTKKGLSGGKKEVRSTDESPFIILNHCLYAENRRTLLIPIGSIQFCFSVVKEGKKPITNGPEKLLEQIYVSLGARHFR